MMVLICQNSLTLYTYNQGFHSMQIILHYTNKWRRGCNVMSQLPKIEID